MGKRVGVARNDPARPVRISECGYITMLCHSLKEFTLLSYITFSVNAGNDDDDEDKFYELLPVVSVTLLLLILIYRRSKIGVRRYYDTAREAQREAYEALCVIAFTAPYTPSSIS